VFGMGYGRRKAFVRGAWTETDDGLNCDNDVTAVSRPFGGTASARRRLAVLLGPLVGLLVVISLAAPASASAQGTASFTYPLNGATNVQTYKPFTWTSVPGVTMYYLDVGTSQGSSNLVSTWGGLTTTSYQLPPLPTGETLWARLWTDVSGTWTYQDISFTAGNLATTYFSYPSNGATAVDTATPFSWYAVPGVTEYYLYVGTSQGSSNLVSSGAVTATSYQVPPLPTGETLWARIWTDTNGTWTYQDISFQAGPQSHATFTYPANGSSTVNTTNNFTWATAPAAQAYYLYIGTSQGASNLVNSGALSASTTSYGVPALPTGETLWARIWTEVNGSWSYDQDISFQVSISAAQLTYPTPGQTNVDSRQAVTWTPAPDAQGYYVWLGTSSGSKNLFESGALPATATSVQMPALPVGQTIYARLFTEINGSWNVYESETFTVAYSAATLTSPSPSTLNVGFNTSNGFTWNSIPGVSGYYLWVGTSQGSENVVNSGEISASQTSYNTGPLPVGELLWARLWTLSSGGWIYAGDVEFSPGALITSPAQQTLAFNPSQAVSWAPGAVVDGNQPMYELKVGSAPGQNDLFDSGKISTTSMTVPSSDLPSGEPLYTEVIYYLGGGTQRRSDNVFEVGGTPAGAQMNWGTGGSSAVDTSLPFTWAATPFAEAYQLQIVNESGTAVANSGAIDVPEYFDEALPDGSYTAQLGTEIGGQWFTTSSPFTVTNSGSSATNEVAAAHWATNFVRQMADNSNYPYGWTPLASQMLTQGTFYQSNCANFAYELITILQQMNIAASQTSNHQPQALNTYFDANDGHTLVQFWDSAQSDWIVLDPTFDMAAQDTASGSWSSPQDLQAATQSQNWSSITYVPLGPHGFADADTYYLDYPLLWLNPQGQSPWNSPTPYMTQITTWPTGGQTGVYTVTANQNPVTVDVNGNPESMSLSSIDNFAAMFLASSVGLPSGNSASVTLDEPNCYVFTSNSFCPAG
jgi:hypothetical protein